MTTTQVAVKRPLLVQLTAIEVIVAAAGLLLVAAMLTLTNGSVALRSFISLPVPVLLAGFAATSLLVGPNRAAARTESENVHAAATNPLLRGLLSIVLGVLSLLVVALVLNTTEITIDTVSLVAGDAIIAFALVLGAQWRSPGLRFRLTATAGRQSASMVVGLGLLVGAVAVAQAIIPKETEYYTTFSFSDQYLVRSSSLTATPGQALQLGWTLRSFETNLGTAAPAINVTIGGKPAVGAQVFLLITRDSSSTEPDSVQTGAISFSAPRDPGFYVLVLEATPTKAEVDGEIAHTLMLNLHLEVKA